MSNNIFLNSFSKIDGINSEPLIRTVLTILPPGGNLKI
jgi:hypothetical protein